MGGIFINYRRHEPTDDVREDLFERLQRHFGKEMVFRDISSILPGQRYPDALRERVADCEVLLVVVHQGWVATRDESGVRRLDREDDWVRLEIELALGAGKTVIPLLLDGAEPPKPDELPGRIRDLAHRQAHRLRGDRRHADLTGLIAVLEPDVAPTWQPIPPTERRRVRPGRWLGVATAILASVVLCAVLALAREESRAGKGGLPFAYATVGSCLGMCAPLLAVGAVHGLLRRSVNSWERELHTIKHRTYIRQTYPIAVALLLIPLFGALSLKGDPGTEMSLVLLLPLCIAVGWAASTNVRLEKRDQDLWSRWPQGLPAPVTRPALRRAIARLERRMSMDGWVRPLPRDLREKAQWELADIQEALTGLDREARRSRVDWLSQDHPWMFGFYVVWVTLTTALAFASALAFSATGTGTSRTYVALVAVPLIGAAVSLGTMEIGHRHQRWQRHELVTEAAERRGVLAEHLADLSSPARVKPIAPAPRPEEHAEPD
jgi:hypothetical protein